MPNPVQGGTLGRTDEGVDISGTPGAAIYDPVPGTSQYVTQVPWWKGQPYYLFKVLTGAFKDRFWYAAEQIRSNLRPGAQVQQGGQIGTYAQTGTATEFGWGTSTPGEALAAPHYQEGDVTQEGLSFRRQIIGGAAGPGYGGARPGGGAAGAPTDNSDGPAQLMQNYLNLRDMPRTAPPNTKNPWQWFQASFTGNWDSLGVSSGPGTTAMPSADSGSGDTGPVPGYVPPHYRDWVAQAAAGTGIPAAVVAAQINTESSFNPNVTSPAGAQGIAQFMPGTWSGLGIGGTPYNPDDALKGYIKFMGNLVQQYHGDLRKALAAYNAGSANLGAGYGYADTILARARH